MAPRRTRPVPPRSLGEAALSSQRPPNRNRAATGAFAALRPAPPHVPGRAAGGAPAAAAPPPGSGSHSSSSCGRRPPRSRTAATRRSRIRLCRRLCRRCPGAARCHRSRGPASQASGATALNARPGGAAAWPAPRARLAPRPPPSAPAARAPPAPRQPPERENGA